MRFAGSAHAAQAGDAAAGWTFTCAAGAGGEHGKLLREFDGPAVRAFSSFGVAGPHENFAVLLTFPAMKFVNWHEGKIDKSKGTSSLDVRIGD